MNIFAEIYHNNGWKGKQSRSGPGSSLEATTIIRKELLLLIEQLEIKRFIDCPCGDFNWMQHIQIPCEYIGVDVVPDIIMSNQKKSNKTFICLDASKDTMPKGDIIFSRDFLVHLSEQDIRLVISNFKKSGSKWWLMTHFTDDREWIPVKTGCWRPINFCKAPFHFPIPQKIIIEGHPVAKDKSLGLWRLEDIT